MIPDDGLREYNLLVSLPAVKGDAGLPLPTGLEHPGPWLWNVEKGTDVHGSVGPESRKNPLTNVLKKEGQSTPPWDSL